MPQPDPTFRAELVGHTAQLRALARRLVRSDEADDLAQDAMVVALSHAERPRALRNWLRQVLRNEHRTRARKSMRRRDREQRSALNEPVSAPADDLAHAQILVALRDVVRELQEPYRGAIQARFFEDRSAADIARAEGCPAATVRWRVREGLKQTRRKLDERFDGRNQWLGALVAFGGAPIVPPPNTLTTAGQPMSKLAILKALTATAAVAGTIAVVNATSQPTHAATEDADAQEFAAEWAPDPAVSDPAVAMRSAADAIVGAAIDGHHEAEHTHAEGPAAEVDPSSPGCDGDDHGCGPNAPSGLFRALGECLGGGDDLENLLPLKARLDVMVHFAEGGDDEYVVDKVTIARAEGIAAPDLATCLTEALEGTSLEVQGAVDETKAIMITLRGMEGPGDGQADRVIVPAGPGSTEAGARDPMLAIDELALPRRGSSTPKVSIVECAEFDCPFCDKARETLDRIEAEYGDTVSVHWMHNPLPFHAGAEIAALAATAAGNQGKFWEMHDVLFDEPDARAEKDMIRHAEALGLDVARFTEDLHAPATQAAIDEQKATCLGNGAKGTPAFFVNGDLIVGARPYEHFRTIIDDELAG